jgi:hypothetical protein
MKLKALATTPTAFLTGIGGIFGYRVFEQNRYTKTRAAPVGSDLVEIAVAFMNTTALIRTSNALFQVSHPRLLQSFAWRRTTLVECAHKVHWISSSQ